MGEWAFLLAFFFFDWVLVEFEFIYSVHFVKEVDALIRRVSYVFKLVQVVT